VRFRPVLEVIRRRRRKDAAWLDPGKGPWWLEPLAKRRIRKRVRSKSWAGPRIFRRHRFPSWLVQQGAYWVTNVLRARKAKLGLRRLWRGNARLARLHRFPAWLVQQGAYWFRARHRRPTYKSFRPRRHKYFPQQPFAALAAYIPYRRKRRPAHPAWLGPPPSQRRRHKIVTQWLTLVLATKSWVWNPQSPALTVALGVVSKAWAWNAQSTLLNLGFLAASKAWVWAKSAPALTAGLGMVSKAWRWNAQAPTINLPVASLLRTLISFVYPGWKRGH